MSECCCLSMAVSLKAHRHDMARLRAAKWHGDVPSCQQQDCRRACWCQAAMSAKGPFLSIRVPDQMRQSRGRPQRRTSQRLKVCGHTCCLGSRLQEASAFLFRKDKDFPRQGIPDKTPATSALSVITNRGTISKKASEQIRTRTGRWGTLKQGCCHK